MEIEEAAGEESDDDLEWIEAGRESDAEAEIDLDDEEWLFGQSDDEGDGIDDPAAEDEGVPAPPAVPPGGGGRARNKRRYAVRGRREFLREPKVPTDQEIE